MDYESTSEWQARLGNQVRSLRIASLLGQAELAERANVSVEAVRSLERGSGSSLKTLIHVVRVLDRTEWLDSLDPIGAGPSPIEQLRRSRRQSPRPQRVPRSR